MLILSTDTQTHMEMAHRQIQEEKSKEPAEEITEERFLKDLYLFMRKRDTPIERIPNLGFKQIDLFVMFKVVRDLGGYHQVTAQQLWKQVYNTLGGNPRSTSAATCTRRHYEKLLLPYECHLTGILVLPHNNQPKHFPFANFSKELDDGQQPAKRKLLSLPLHQNPHNLQSDSHDRVFPLPPHYPHYYHPSHTVLPPHVPISSSVLTPQSPPAPKTWFPLPLSHPTPTDRVKEPLEQLRYLAEQYKTTSRLSEPLNLSVKASSQETNSNPASSFTTPPKFLNKPSPLYSPRHPPVVRNDDCEPQDAQTGFRDTAYSYPLKSREDYVIDVEAIADSSSPAYDSAPTQRTYEGVTTMAQKPCSPKTDLTIRPKEDRQGSPEVQELNLSHILPSLPPEKGGKMEIEVPLSVFHNWLRLCGSSVMMHGAKQLPSFRPPEEHSAQRNCSDADVLPTNLTFHMNPPKHQSSVAEDLRLTQRNLPSPIRTAQTAGNHYNTSQSHTASNHYNTSQSHTTGNHYNTSQSHTIGNHYNISQNHFTTYKPLPSGGILKNASSQDVYPFDQQRINKSYSSKPPNCWDAYNNESQAPPIPVNTEPSPCAVQHNFAASLSYNEDTVQGGKEKSDTGPPALLMLNSSSTSLLHLTTEEMMKLKKMISSSS